MMHHSSGARTFGELASRYFTIVIAYLSSDTCTSVHLVFDQYWPTSIKSGERTRRGSSDAFKVRTTGPNTPVPKQWVKYIQNPQNKINLCDFGQERLMQVVEITRARPTEDIDALKSNHEEADTRMILHAAYAVRDSPYVCDCDQIPRYRCTCPVRVPFHRHWMQRAMVLHRC